MLKLTPAARQARITAYRQTVLTQLAHRVINVATTHTDLYADGDPSKKMASLNGAVLLERDLFPDGKLRGVVSIDVNALAAQLPDLKADTTDAMGWKKHLDAFAAEGVDLLANVALPVPSEYDTSAIDDLLALDISTLADARSTLAQIQAKAKAGNIL